MPWIDLFGIVGFELVLIVVVVRFVRVSQFFLPSLVVVVVLVACEVAVFVVLVWVVRLEVGEGVLVTGRLQERLGVLILVMTLVISCVLAVVTRFLFLGVVILVVISLLLLLVMLLLRELVMMLRLGRMVIPLVLLMVIRVLGLLVMLADLVMLWLVLMVTRRLVMRLPRMGMSWKMP